MSETVAPPLNVRRRRGIIVIDVPPDRVVQLNDIAQICESLEELVEQEDKQATYLLTFSQVKHVSSTFLGRLISLNKRIKARRGCLMLSDLEPPVRQVVSLAQIDKQIPVYRTAAEAISGRTAPWTVLLGILCINAMLGINGLTHLVMGGWPDESRTSDGIALACFIASIPLPVAIFVARKWFARLDRAFQWTLVGIFAFVSACALPAYLGWG